MRVTVIKRMMEQVIKYRLEFKFDIILSIIFSLLQAFLLSYIWKSVGFERAVEYYLIVTISSYFLAEYLLILVDNDVRTSGMIRRILLPIKIDFQYLFPMISGTILFNFLEVVPIILLFSIFFKINFKGVFLVLLDSFLIFLLSFYFYFLISSISFKTESSWGFRWAIRLITIKLFGGYLIPIPLLSKIFGDWVEYLPFKYMLGVSFEIYNGKLSGIIFQIIYITFFYVISNLIWKGTLKEYQGYGV